VPVRSAISRPDPVQHQKGLLLLVLYRDEPHAGRCTASQHASASAGSCLFVFT
jgi:hypothetical protein